MEQIKIFLLGAAKAVVAAALPIAAALIAKGVSDIEIMVPALIAAAVNALSVYLVPNKQV